MGSVLQTGSEVATINTGADFLDVGYAEASVQTSPEGRYVDSGVQTHDPEVPPGALMPLPDKTPLLDLVPMEPRPISPTLTASSRSQSPSRFPRMTIARKMSLASVASSTQMPLPPVAPQMEDSTLSDTTTAVRRSTSLRSLGLRRAFGSKKSSGATAAPTVAVSSSVPPLPMETASTVKLAPADVPVSVSVPVTSSPDQQPGEVPVPPPNNRTASRKLFGVVKRFGKANNVVDALKSASA